MSDKPPITIFDMQTLPLLFQIIKAMIPFLDFPMAKMLSVIIRLNELNYTINYFRSPDCADFISCNSSIPHIHSISDLLENDDFICAILPYCPPEYAGLIKNFKLFSNMSSMFNSDTDSLKNFMSMYNASNSAQDSSSDFHSDSGSNCKNSSRPSQFGSFMDSSQQKLYDEYLKQLDSLDQKLNDSQT